MNSQGKISAPIGLIPDVYGVLGISPTNGWYDVGYACANAHGKINMWAKYKPEQNAQFAALTDAQRKNNNYGITIPRYTSTGGPTTAGSLINALVNGVTWTYAPPTSYFRLSDFNGYNHNAKRPFGVELPDTVYLSTDSTLTLEFEIQAAGDGSNLILSDFQVEGVSFADMYPGIVLYNPSTGRWIIATSKNKLGGSYQIVAENMSSAQGTWTAYFFLSSVLITTTSGAVVGTYIPMPVPARQITIAGWGTEMTIMAYGTWNKAHDQLLNVTYQITNSTGVQKTVTGINVSLRRKTVGQDNQASSLIMNIVSNATQTVAAVGRGSMFSVGTVNVVHNYSAAYEYYLVASATGIAESYNQVEEDPGL